MEKTEMKMENAMPEMMTANLTDEMPEQEEKMSQKDAIVGLIKNQMIELDLSIDEADKEFARAHHKDKYSEKTYRLEDHCKMLNAQKNILETILSAIDSMFPMMSDTMSAIA